MVGINFRIYRAAFAPALATVVVLLFSLQGRPAPLPPVVASAEFDEHAAAKIDRQIVDAAPVRTPGSEGDGVTADLVANRFGSIPEGQVTEQRFDHDFDGEQVELRNLILTLPGESARSVVVLAARDSASGPGAASSAAATATLLELVDKLRTSRHTKTLVFVSTDGGSDGAAGAREFAERYAERELIDGAIALWQPGSATPREPSLLDASDGSQSPSAQLVRTAERALSEQAGRQPQLEGLFGELSRLALPSGLSEQAVLIEHGIDAVGLSSAGERPLPVADDQPDDLSAATIGDLGRTALLLVATLDGTAAPPEHGPATYLTLAGNLVPGWTLGLLALTLLLPPALASLDAMRQAFRRGTGAALGAGLGCVEVAASACRPAPLLPARDNWDRRQARVSVRSQPLSSRSGTDHCDDLAGDRDRGRLLRDPRLARAGGPAPRAGRCGTRPGLRVRRAARLARESVPGASARTGGTRLAARRTPSGPAPMAGGAGGDRGVAAAHLARPSSSSSRGWISGSAHPGTSS